VVNTRIIVDWSQIASASAFYDLVLPQCGSPSWHGRNLNALNDSWVTGDIDSGGPPFDFVIQNMDTVSQTLSPIADAVLQIAQASVAANGGSCVWI